MLEDDATCSLKKTALKIICRRPCRLAFSRKASVPALPIPGANDASIDPATVSCLSLLPDFSSGLNEPGDGITKPQRTPRAVRFSEPLTHYHFYEPDLNATEHNHCIRRTPGRPHLSLNGDDISLSGLRDGFSFALTEERRILPKNRRSTVFQTDLPIVSGLYSTRLVTPNDDDAHVEDALYGNTQLFSLRRLRGSSSNRTASEHTTVPSGFSNSLRDFDHLQRRTNQFIQSLCIVNTRLRDRPIIVTSKDLIPKKPLSIGEGLYLDDYLDEQDWIIQDSTDEDSHQLYHLLLKYPLNDHVSKGPAEDTHQEISSDSGYCMYAQVDITEMVEGIFFDLWAEDVWLKIAADELKKLTVRQSVFWQHISLLHQPLLAKEELWEIVSSIRSFYELHFVLSLQATFSTTYKTTYVSSGLLQFGKDLILRIMTIIHEKQQISYLLQRGERFFFDTRQDLTEPRQLICCVPMFGPVLTCWLCFLISGSIFEQCAQQMRDLGSRPNK